MPSRNKKRAKRQQPKRIRKIKKTKPKKRIKKNRRNQAKFPALDKKFNLLSRKDLLDFDYLDKLNDREKAWLNKFVEEEINASFNHPNPLNKSKKQRKRCYNANNARNRDLLTRNKVIGNVEDIMSVTEVSQINPEEILIRKEEKELQELNNLDNTFNSTENSEQSAKK